MAPVFRSTPTSFFVTLYNLNCRITVENTDIDKTKQGHSEEKADFEMRVSDIKANQPTKNNIIKLFRQFGFEQMFSRSDIISITGLGSSAASELANKMKRFGLTEPVSGLGKGKYRFARISK